jgi:hypothetical protein
VENSVSNEQSITNGVQQTQVYKDSLIS